MAGAAESCSRSCPVWKLLGPLSLDCLCAPLCPGLAPHPHPIQLPSFPPYPSLQPPGFLGSPKHTTLPLPEDAWPFSRFPQHRTLRGLTPSLSRVFVYRSSLQGGQSLTTLFKVAPTPHCTLTPLFLLHFLHNTLYNFTN